MKYNFSTQNLMKKRKKLILDLMIVMKMKVNKANKN